jgi:integrase/recombinase XerD
MKKEQKSPLHSCSEGKRNGGVLVVRDAEIVSSLPKDLTTPRGDVSMEKVKYWDKEYLHSMIEHIENTEHKMLFTLLWMTGVRVSEAINLVKSNIDTSNFTMTVRWQKREKKKGMWQRRVVPLHPEIKNLLQVYTAPMAPDAIVFPYSRQRVWQLTKKYFNGNPHMFRHSFAVNYLRQGGNIVNLKNLMGHSSVTVTMEYLKIVPTDIGKELMTIKF